MKEKNALIKQEIYKAIAYFIERQHLVAQAMRDLGLDLEEVGKWGAAAWTSGQETGKEPNFDLDESASDEMWELFNVARRAVARKLPQSSVWGNTGEWTYFLHGTGCRLHNTHTGEIIDWNCPNVLAFDPYFFLKHLEWQLESHYRDEELQYTREWIQQQPEGLKSIISLIDEMVDNGLIDRDLTLPAIDWKEIE